MSTARVSGLTIVNENGYNRRGLYRSEQRVLHHLDPVRPPQCSPNSATNICSACAVPPGCHNATKVQHLRVSRCQRCQRHVCVALRSFTVHRKSPAACHPLTSDDRQVTSLSLPAACHPLPLTGQVQIPDAAPLPLLLIIRVVNSPHCHKAKQTYKQTHSTAPKQQTHSTAKKQNKTKNNYLAKLTQPLCHKAKQTYK